MWVMVVLYAGTAGQFSCASLKDCVSKYEQAALSGVLDGYCIGPQGRRVDIVKDSRQVLRTLDFQ
jgi:hypothetical protein